MSIQHDARIRALETRCAQIEDDLRLLRQRVKADETSVDAHPVVTLAPREPAIAPAPAFLTPNQQAAQRHQKGR
jgi:uncharacterized coiled-coil protein SlyX